jgi:hypothetical protein
MATYAPFIKVKPHPRVPNSQYVKAEDKPDDDTKPVEPAAPEQPED